jgi:hypothetical protein
MSTAHIVVPSIAPGACGIAVSLASGSAKQAKALADARRAGAAALGLRAIAVANAAENISEHQASKRSESVNGVRPGAAILTRAQK